jgi:hypothetical protein
MVLLLLEEELMVGGLANVYKSMKRGLSWRTEKKTDFISI